MQGKQNAPSSERKGPHKSMHCKFCKPPGVVTPEKTTRPQLETKTNIHLVHEGADLRVCDVSDEPGVPDVDTEACVCVLEGENPCPKCVPDKNRPMIKKKTCRCPKGAKPNPNADDGETPMKKKEKVEDDEFWWEKYSREHDAMARETWAAYMAHRRKEKKLAKCEKRRQEKLLRKKSKDDPNWYQKLSCQQMIYVEFLATAIRLDSDENITDRTFFVLGGIGLYPRPKRKILKKCLRYCHYNSIQFLNQLHLLTKDDDVFHEKPFLPPSKYASTFYSWNERLIMSAICHLEFPMLLGELIDRLPPLPQDEILPQIPYPVFPKLPRKKYDNPYEEPIWQERVNWVEKMKIDRLNRCRAHMDTKRIKIPPLALVRRPSLIDARPPFLSLIEANEQASRRIQKQDEKRTARKHPVSTFNSAVDVTAIAGIEASEISTTDKADTDEICVFLREPLKEPEYAEEDEFDKEVDGSSREEPENVTTEIDRLARFSEADEGEEEEEEEGGVGIGGDDIPFRTPPKTESGATIQQPCNPPESSPGLPALHYERAKRELDILNEELCKFHPFVSSSTQTIKQDNFRKNDDDEVRRQLMTAAEKLKQYAEEVPEPDKEKKPTKRKPVRKTKNKTKYKQMKEASVKGYGKKIQAGKKKPSIVKITDYENYQDPIDVKEEEEEFEEFGEMAEEDELLFAFISGIGKKKKKLVQRESIVSDPDPDPDSEDEWSAKRPCLPDLEQAKEVTSKKRRRKRFRGRRKRKEKEKKDKKAKNKKKDKEKKGKENQRITGSKQEEEKGKAGDWLGSKESVAKLDKETMTECHPGQFDHSSGEEKARAKEAKEAKEAREAKDASEPRNVFEGDIKPILLQIIRDLVDEGYVSASYSDVAKHPDIEQLCQYLRGEIVTKATRERLHNFTKLKWMKKVDVLKFHVNDLGISVKKLKNATWNDKNWICRLAKAKKDEFYFKVASSRANEGKELYKTLHQNYFGTGRYLKIYYAYMIPKYEEAILRGVI